MRGSMSQVQHVPQAPYLSKSEMRSSCLEALKSVDLLPKQPEPVRIDRFIEKKFGIEPQYRDLPDGVLGYTQFRDGRVTAMVVSQSLDCDDSSVNGRRLRTTFAHEAGHCLLHSTLFDHEDPGPALFPEVSQRVEQDILCRSADVGFQHGYVGDRLEYQANQAIGALLLPWPLAGSVLEPFTKLGPLGARAIVQGRLEDAVRRLSRVFNVNPVVVRIWIKEFLGPNP